MSLVQNKDFDDDLWIKGHDKPEIIIIWAWHIHKEIAHYLRKSDILEKSYSTSKI